MVAKHLCMARAQVGGREDFITFALSDPIETRRQYFAVTLQTSIRANYERPCKVRIAHANGIALFL